MWICVGSTPSATVMPPPSAFFSPGQFASQICAVCSGAPDTVNGVTTNCQPLIPGEPAGPAAPEGPTGPDGQVDPFGPCRPVAPLGPGSPLSPFGPGGPCG